MPTGHLSAETLFDIEVPQCSRHRTKHGQDSMAMVHEFAEAEQPQIDFVVFATKLMAAQV